MMTKSLDVKGLYKDFGKLTLFSDFSISFATEMITCILGPSGCGKTTLLNIIGNIIKADGGELTGFGEKIISYIFQDPRLLPWKTVEDNISFVLGNDIPWKERKETAEHFIRLVGLEGFAGYYPAKLSGGMRQRVSIARAFAYPSDIILMDEPFKGLDIKLKLNLIQVFAQLWQANRRTVIFVTHDVDEALLLGNEIIVFSQAPVQIIIHKKVEIPLTNRMIDTIYFKRLKKRLLNQL